MRTEAVGADAPRRARPRAAIAACVLALMALTGCVTGDTGPVRLAQSNDRATEGGIGGTGIVGVVTGLGSIRVNGFRVVADADAAVASVFGPRRFDELRVGETVAVFAEAGGAPASRLPATRMALRYPAIGPIEALDAAQGRLRVAGAEVRIERGAMAPADLAMGQVVAVSGIWTADGVRASRIERLSVGGLVSVAGVVTGYGPGRIFIEGVSLRLDGGVAPAPVGAFMHAVGRIHDGAPLITGLRPSLFARVGGRIKTVSAEGTVAVGLDAEAGAHRIRGLGLSIAPRARLSAMEDRRGVFIGSVADERFEIVHGLPLADGDATARAETLNAIEDGYRPTGAEAYE